MATNYIQRAELFLAGVIADNTFDSTLDGLQVTGGGAGSVSCKLHVHDELQNRYGTLHGGCIATLVDVVGSAALVTISDKGGVSLAINTLYLNPMPGGEDVNIDARVVKLGKDIGTIEVVLKRASTGEVVSTGTHVKKLVGMSDLSQLFRGLDEQPQQQARQQQLDSNQNQHSTLHESQPHPHQQQGRNTRSKL